MASGDSESRKKMLPNQSHLNLVLSVPRTKGIEDICSMSISFYVYRYDRNAAGRYGVPSEGA
jgi:hypothetical protein